MTKRKNQWPLRATDGTTVTMQDLQSFCSALAPELRDIDPDSLDPDPMMPGRQVHALRQHISKCELWATASVKPRVVAQPWIDAAAALKAAPYKSALSFWRQSIQQAIQPARAGAARPTPSTPSRPSPGTPSIPTPTRPTTTPTATTTPVPAAPTPPTPTVAERFDGAVKQAMATRLMNRQTAVRFVQQNDPELYQAYVADGQRRFGARR